MLRILFYILISATTFTVFGQTITFIEDKSNQPISNVFVYNKNSQNSLSDYYGNVNIAGFSTDSIIVQHSSYSPRILAFPSSDTTIILIPKNVLIEEIVFTASRHNEKTKEVPFKVNLISQKAIEVSNVVNSADLLEENGDVLIQKTQGGGGSPILRGFEANKLLLVVDGIRMNNAIYRNGHLQNSMTVDHASIEKAEIIFGPNSLMYGSDAIGGVVHYRTINPILQDNADSSKINIEGNAFMKHNLSFGSQTNHMDVSIGKKKIAFLGSITQSHYGNIVMGKNRNSNYPSNFGLHELYTNVSDSGDFVLNNNNRSEQLYTSYNQLDMLGKVLVKPAKHLELVSNVQYSESSDIHRYDNLIDFSKNKPKYSEWYYGPQKRVLFAEHLECSKETFLFDQVDVSLSYQNIEESRHSRKFGKTDLLSQIENVELYSINADFFLNVKGFTIYYGGESNLNNVQSEAYYTNIDNQKQAIAQTRYPNGGSSTFDVAMYLSAKKNITKDFIVNAGGRYNYYSLDATFDKTVFVELPFKKVAFTNLAPSANIGLLYIPKQWKISAMASSGFRNPNIDDIGKVRAKSEQILVPSGSITPEFAYNTELTVERSFFGKHSLGITAYSVWVTHIISRVPYLLNGRDSLLYDGDMYELYTNKNTDLAIVRGVSATAKGRIVPSVTYMASFNYTYGKNMSLDQPLGHIPPIFGKISTEWKYKNFNTELYAKYNGWKYIADMPSTGEDNEDQGTEDGFPAWYTVNVRSSYKISNHASILFAVENIMDAYYKPFASAVSGAGRNFSFGIKAHF